MCDEEKLFRVRHRHHHESLALAMWNVYVAEGFLV